MKEIKLHGVGGKDKLALVDDEDFDALNKYKWHFGSRYVRRCIYIGGGRKNQKNKILLMHRVIMNTPDELVTDHINGNTLDNRKENLRICTNAENIRKGKMPKSNTSGFMGVSWSTEKRKWVARIQFNYKQIIIGYFKDKEDAAKAYDTKAKELFGKFCNLNFK